MQKEELVLDYYCICNKLKDIVRTGWKDWKVKRERVESIAEHVYGGTNASTSYQKCISI